MGLNFAEGELPYGITGNTGGPIGRITGDSCLTDALAMQLDLSATSYAGGTLGQIDAHIYLMPRESFKYGVFVSLADVDGREATIGSAGVEVISDVSDRTQIEAKAEIGIATHRMAGARRNMDFIAARFGAFHTFNDTTTAYIEASVSEFDEAFLRAVANGVRVGLHYDIPSQPIRISATIGYDKMSDRNSRKGEVVTQIGVT
ncbi:hypothetical protein [Pseudorhodobacter ferrugineus]|uniref:hypothetical protein n=1 Tax=Pseudorhodobacter ferrugineus TaxID=77008 RepID=UPI0003B40074|nr:hypothetical protein [Pseudorhodobacter ferrugineus]